MAGPQRRLSQSRRTQRLPPRRFQHVRWRDPRVQYLATWRDRPSLHRIQVDPEVGEGPPSSILNSAKYRGQSIEELDLALDQLGTSRRQGEPLRSVDLWKPLDLRRPRWPLEFELIALHRGRHEIRCFDRPNAYAFPTRLLDFAEIERPAGRSLDSDLFDELAVRDRTIVLARFVFTLGDRPRAVILAGPKGPSRVHDEYFDVTGWLTPKRQQAGTSLGHSMLFT